MAAAGAPETESRRRCVKGRGHRRAMLCWSQRLALTSIQDPNLGVPPTFLESLTFSLASAVHVPLALPPAVELQPYHLV